MSALIDMAKAEVLARHAFFVAWFTGKAGTDRMAETARAFAPDFQMLWPDMGLDNRETLLAKLQAARGQSPANYDIQITFVHTGLINADTALIICDERQTVGDTNNARRMTAVFTPAPDAPEGVHWRHVHQSWLTD